MWCFGIKSCFFFHLSERLFLSFSICFMLPVFLTESLLYSLSATAPTVWLIHCGMVKALHTHTHTHTGLCLQWKPCRHGISFHIQLRPKKLGEKSSEKIICTHTHTHTHTCTRAHLHTNICVNIKPASHTNINSLNTMLMWYNTQFINPPKRHQLYTKTTTLHPNTHTRIQRHTHTHPPL